MQPAIDEICRIRGLPGTGFVIPMFRPKQLGADVIVEIGPYPRENTLGTYLIA